MSPLYDFTCTKCGLEREILCSVAGDMAPEFMKCPQCGNDKLKRLPSAPNFKVKDGTPIFHGGKE